MTDHEKLVMRNIIYAVETGGQVYGQKDYADFTEAYTNSSAEHAITIGAGQWYGNEARTLLLKIKTTDAATFSKYDTAGVAADLNKTDWSNYQLSKTSAKAKAIVHIINSTVGHRCQDQLMDGQMETYVKEAASLGVTAMDAKMMCANFRHQGGLSALVHDAPPFGFCGEKDSCQDYKALHTGSSLYCLPDRYRKSGRSI